MTPAPARPAPSRAAGRRGRGSRRVAPALGMALGSVLLASCSSDDGGGAGDEDALVVYVGRDEELVAPLLEQFSEESGVEVEARYAETPDQLALLLEEGDATPADVFLSQDAGALGALAATGALRGLPSSITDAVSADFTSRDGSWVGVTGRARVVAYDSESLEESEVPTAVEDLTDPDWSGRIGLAPTNASFQSFVTGFRAAEGDEAARAWLDGVAANDPQTYEGNGDVLEALEGGTIDVGLINHYYVKQLEAELGADEVATELVFPEAGDPGALVNVTGAGILSDHPDAEELVSYLVSEQGQEYFVENTFEYPLAPGVPAPEGLPALEDVEGPIEDLAELDDLEASIAMIDEAGLS